MAIVFHNLKHYDSRLIIQELDQLNFKINVIPNELGKCMSFSINIKFIFIDSFQSLSSSLDRLNKNLSKDVFKYLSQEFDSNVLDLVKLKRFYWYEYMSEYMSDFKDSKNNCQRKKSFTAKRLCV